MFLLAVSGVGYLTLVLWLVFMAAEDPIVRSYRIFFLGDSRDWIWPSCVGWVR